MAIIDVISLTRKLISFNTINPPGNESEIARYVGNLLSENGFNVDYPAFAKNRLHVIAERGLSETSPPIVLSGHFDTVPPGAKKWDANPLSGEIIENKIYGRGSSDMKGGLAAMICAAISSFEKTPPVGGIRIIFTAAEELGCQGAVQLAKTYKNFGSTSAIVIGEPTANIPAIGHKGALYINASAKGITAHSSMPGLGENAIYKVARAINKIEKFNFGVEKDLLLGLPTVNVGKMKGGMNINSVPDHAEFTIDIRTTGKMGHNTIIEKLHRELGDDINLEILVDLNPVYTDENDPFVQMAYTICKEKDGSGNSPVSLPYLTDGSVLQPLYNGVPTIILGPGQPEMAHQTDEFCYIQDIEQAVSIYKQIILKLGENKMMDYQEKILNEEQLDEMLSKPSAEAVEMFSRVDGDIMILGVAGKIGPSLVRMVKRACDEAGVDKKIYGVSLFESDEQQKKIESIGIKTIHGDLLNTEFIKSLPKAKNVFFLAGMKFGSLDNLSLTWAVNSYLPALVVEHFKNSRIVAFSTGCVYPLVSVETGGSLETDLPEPVGEYAQSCLGRERMFEYGSIQNKTKVALIRLNYSVELRYGVLVDVATKVKTGQEIDLAMGYFNVIWQGDVNDVVLRSLEQCESPAKALNITGSEILSVREVAEEFGKLFGIEPKLVNKESKTALLSNSELVYSIFGRPKMPINQVINWISGWIGDDKRLLGKPTHYEVRDGKY